MLGLFDSGFGGLTILRALVAAMPQYDYLYVGDNARAPYGGRSADKIYAFTKKGVEYLFDQGCPLVILACNTASAVALRRLQAEVAPSSGTRRVLGIIVPTIEQITGVAWHSSVVERLATPKTVGVLATQRTVDSETYVKEIHKRNPAVTIIQQACPELAPMIEAGGGESDLTATAKKYVDLLLEKNNQLDAVLLGCTHYELIAPLIATLLPAGVTLYEQPAIVAESIQNYLNQHPKIAKLLTTSATVTLQSTKAGKETDTIGSRFYGSPISFSPIVL